MQLRIHQQFKYFSANPATSELRLSSCFMWHSTLILYYLACGCSVDLIFKDILYAEWAFLPTSKRVSAIPHEAKSRAFILYWRCLPKES
jgi:hypothetical protein